MNAIGTVFEHNKYMKKLLFLILLIPLLTKAQIRTNDSIAISNDTLVAQEIVLEGVKIIEFKPLKFSSTKARNHYYWLQKKVYHAYPYAKIAAEKLEALNRELITIKSKHKRKKHIRKVQKYLEGEFTDQLKKLTKTEGQILTKLVYRQTGITTYQLVKNLRSGWRAFWYQRTAKLFSIDLKAKYNPNTVKDDFLVEDILQRFFAKGLLDEQEKKIDFDYYALIKKWGEY